MSSWEDIPVDDKPPVVEKPKATLNPTAKAFSFNPATAKAFTPSWLPASAAAAPAPVAAPKPVAPLSVPAASAAAVPAPVKAAAAKPATAATASPAKVAVAAPVKAAIPVPSSVDSLSAGIKAVHISAPKDEIEDEMPDEHEEGSDEKCPMCGKLVSDHSEAELDKCIEEEDAKSAALAEKAPAAAVAAAPVKGAAESKAAVEEEEEPVIIAEDEDPRENMNVVFIGHVDAGKSTISGNILFLTGMVDKRMIEKFEREAKERNRESWFLAFIMDTDETERAKGITVEVGRAMFATPAKRYTMLDAPGHKGYVPNMIAGASQADVGVLVISARKGEFEAGFDKSGQTREHALLAKTLGVRKLIIVINKMDESTVCWNQARFDDIKDKLTQFLKTQGWAKDDVIWIPISGLNGSNLKDRYTGKDGAWYGGPSLLETLDNMTLPGRDPTAPLRIPVLDVYYDRGVIIMGKVETGTVRIGDKIKVMPGDREMEVVTVSVDDDSRFVKTAKPGENIRLKVKGITEEEVRKGFVLSSVKSPVRSVVEFEAQIMMLQLSRPIMTAGFTCIMHAHTAVEECVISKILEEHIRVKGEKQIKKRPAFVRSNATIIAIVQLPQSVALDTYAVLPQLGRFSLRDEGRTIGVGRILKLNK